MKSREGLDFGGTTKGGVKAGTSMHGGKPGARSAKCEKSLDEDIVRRKERKRNEKTIQMEWKKNNDPSWRQSPGKIICRKKLREREREQERERAKNRTEEGGPGRGRPAFRSHRRAFHETD